MSIRKHAAGSRTVRRTDAPKSPGHVGQASHGPANRKKVQRRKTGPAGSGALQRLAAAPDVLLHAARPQAVLVVETKPAAEFLDPARCIQRAYYLEARKGFPTDSALAEAIGVSRSQITRWSQGKSARQENAWLLRDLATAVSRLADHFEEPVVHQWLYGNNPELEGEQPIELLRQGRLPEVLMVIEAQTSGAFG